MTDSPDKRDRLELYDCFFWLQTKFFQFCAASCCDSQFLLVPASIDPSSSSECARRIPLQYYINELECFLIKSKVD